MQIESNSSADQQTIVKYLRSLVVLAFAFVLGAAVFTVMALHKLNRVVAVVEIATAKVDRAKAAVGKGVDALVAMDTADLGRAATDGVKEIGRAAKE